jgi:hypothetical protein
MKTDSLGCLRGGALLGALALAACGDDGGGQSLQRRDAGPTPDAAGGAVADAAPPPDMGGAEPDARADGEDAAPPSDAGEADAAVDAAGGQDAAGGAQPDAAPPLGMAPDYNEVAVSTAGETTYVAWRAGDRIRLRAFRGDLQFTGDGVDLAGPVADLAGLAALTVAEIPLVAWAEGDDAPIRIAQGDRPGAAPLELPITGRPMLTEVGGRVLVVGRAPGNDPERPVAWQILNADASPDALPEPVVLPGISARPDALGGIGQAAVLRFGAPGQCIFIDAAGAPLGNFVCKSEPGFLLSNGSNTRLLFVQRRGGARTAAVTAVFGAESFTPFSVGGYDVAAQTPFPPDNGTQPLVLVSRDRNDPEVDRLRLYLPGVDALWRSVDAFDTVPAEWSNVRAVVRRGETAALLEFGHPLDPQIRPLPVVQRVFDAEPYNLNPPNSVPPGCLPTLEQCDNVDQDCDGQPVNGQCCELAQTRWEQVFTPPRPIVGMSVADVPNRDTYFLSFEHDDGSLSAYRAFYVDNANQVQQVPRALDNLIVANENQPAWDLLAARDPIQYLRVGNWNMLVARDAAGLTTVFTGAPSRVAELRRRAPEPIPDCQRVLATDRVVANDDSAKAALIVCPRKVVRLLPEVSEGPDQVLALDDLPPEGAAWATITRVSADVVQILMAYRNAEGAWRFKLVLATAAGGLQISPLPDLALDLQAQGDDAADPVFYDLADTAHMQFLSTGAARVRIKAPGGGYQWTPLLIQGQALDARFGGLNKQVVVRTRAENGYDFWTASTGGDGRVNIWALRKSFSIDAPADAPFFWTVTQGQTNDDAGGYELAPGVVAVLPDVRPGAPAGQWRVVLRGVRCNTP